MRWVTAEFVSLTVLIPASWESGHRWQLDGHGNGSGVRGRQSEGDGDLAARTHVDGTRVAARALAVGDARLLQRRRVVGTVACNTPCTWARQARDAYG